ncbi:hypothetical protein LMF89_13240 [Pelosinus sp. Bkl1]|uniref:Uncharacterized protein n=1 Tax=Pelosinus baikalensis TaxID=2892015 RepID=A0ABS8HT24_9FIRM|nr:hypothetical protein [Pelosinus baikalensis]
MFRFPFLTPHCCPKHARLGSNAGWKLLGVLPDHDNRLVTAEQHWIMHIDCRLRKSICFWVRLL